VVLHNSFFGFSSKDLADKFEGSGLAFNGLAKKEKLVD
jgi:hypothetical protein